MTRAMGLWFVFVVTVTAGGCGRSANQERPSGTVIFASVCANCHGSLGNGGIAATPDAMPPRRFRDAAFQRSRTDEDLGKTIKEGKPPGMPSFGTYDAKQIAELVAMIRGFDPEKK